MDLSPPHGGPTLHARSSPSVPVRREASARPSPAPPTHSQTRRSPRSRRRQARTSSRARSSPRLAAIGRGAERRVATTVRQRLLLPVLLPAVDLQRSTPSRCMPPFDAGQHRAELFETPEIIHPARPVDEEKRRTHPAGGRACARGSPSADDPDDRGHSARQASHCRGGRRGPGCMRCQPSRRCTTTAPRESARLP